MRPPLITDVPEGVPVAHREVYAMTAHDFVAMPAPATLWLEVEGVQGRVAWTTHRPTFQACIARRTPVFVGGEMTMLALGTRDHFVQARDFKRWCKAKRHGRYRLTPAMVLGAAVAGRDPRKATALPLDRRWPLVAVLALLDARLVEVEVHESNRQPQAKAGNQ